MKGLNKHILLLVNNVSVHNIKNPLLLTNIIVHYLLSNTTSHLQSDDVEIINSFKVCIQNYWLKTDILFISIFLEDETVDDFEIKGSDFESERQKVQELLDKYYEYC